MKLLPGNWKKEEMDCRKLAIIEPVVEGWSKFINTSLGTGIFLGSRVWTFWGVILASHCLYFIFRCDSISRFGVWEWVSQKPIS